jgi:predicted NUDIX family NTP pyrophosphohydrolase
MKKISAGLIMYDFDNQKNLRIFLVHPGGPFWKNKDLGVWSIPKGEVDNGENLFSAAKREFFEETGITPSVLDKDYIFLGEIKQKNNKNVCAWAFFGKYLSNFNCKSFVKIKSVDNKNKELEFPEADKGFMFELKTAKQKINPYQKELIARLENKLNLINREKQNKLF